MDGKLSQRQTGATHEMKTLLYRNREHLKRCKVVIGEQYQQMSASIVKDLVEEAKKARQEKPKKAAAFNDSGPEEIIQSVENTLGPDVVPNNPYEEDDELESILEQIEES